MSYHISWDPVTGKVIERHEEDEVMDQSQTLYELGIIHERERIIKDAEDAYPADVFPEPNWDEVREALVTIGVTLDAVAGSLLRRQIPVFIKGEQPVGNSEKLGENK